MSKIGVYLQAHELWLYFLSNLKRNELATYAGIEDDKPV